MAILKSITFSDRSDEALLQLFREHQSQDVLAQLYLRYSDLTFGTCIKYLKDEDAAKDAVMNVYQELVRKLPGHDVANFKSWLYVFTKNYCLMQLRKSKNNITLPIENDFMQSAESLHLDDITSKEKEFDQLHACLGQLQDEQRKCISFFYLEQKCYNEISALTGHDWNKVRSLIQNGKRNLKICMDKSA